MINKLDVKKLKKEQGLRKRGKGGGSNALSSTNNTSSFSRDRAFNQQLLEECYTHWLSLEDFRRRRRRSRMYMRGDQYSDIIPDPDHDGYFTTEKSYIMRQGKVPIKQNFIRQFVRNMVGQYRSNPSDSVVVARSREMATIGEMLTNTLQCCLENNQAKELDARAIEELILSGLCIQKSSYRYFPNLNSEDGYLENINPNRAFFNYDIEDIRGNDIRVIGQIVDKSIDDVISIFAKTKEQEQEIRKIYANAEMLRSMQGKGLSAERLDNLNFLLPDQPNKCRVIEVWYQVAEWRTYCHDYLDAKRFVSPKPSSYFHAINKERIAEGASVGIPAENIPLIDVRPKYETFWKVKYLTPTGECLFEDENPYDHEEHPFTVTFGALIDGEIWGTIEDFIDQQRYINRLVTLIDFAMGSSAKGLLMIPESSITPEYPIHRWTSEWRKVGGVIVYKPKAGEPAPQQITTNSTQIGAHEMLTLQMQMISQISGVNGAIQGQSASSGKPSSLYAQEAQNASTNFKDLLDTFSNGKKNRDTKLLKVICQFYNEKRYVDIAGKSYMDEAKFFDPEKAKDIDYTIIASQGADTPAFRAALDDTLFQLMTGGAIDIEMYLENCSLPFADRLLDSIKKRKEAAQSGEMAAQQGGFTPEQGEMAEQVGKAAQAQSDPRALAMIQQMMSNQNAA